MLRRLWKQLYKEKSFKHHLVLIPINKAHCVKEWSVPVPFSFNLLELVIIGVKIFAKLIGNLRALTHAPVMSLTASAPPPAELDLLDSLHMTNLVMIKHGLDRPNTFYSVAKKRQAFV